MVRVQALLHRLEGLSALDPLTDKLSAAVSTATSPTAVRNALHGSWLGHPAHPLLTDVPIGAWTSAAVLDLVGGERAGDGADVLVALGVASAVPTALTGAADWAEYNDDRVRRVGLVHALSNSVALACQAASLAARRRGRRGLGVALSFTGLGALMVGGYLGGHLSYRLGSGVDRTAFEPAPAEWEDAAAAVTLADGRPHLARVGGVDVVVVDHDGRIDALADRCTHMGGPLHEGELDDGCIRCPWHASTFRLADGAVVRAPATAPQPRFETRVVDGRVQVRAAQPD